MEVMRYTQALRYLFEIMEGRPDIEKIKFNRENDSVEIVSNEKQSGTLKKILEIMEGRPDITEVLFDNANDSFEVVTDHCVHLCFGSEFRNI